MIINRRAWFTIVIGGILIIVGLLGVVFDDNVLMRLGPASIRMMGDAWCIHNGDLPNVRTFVEFTVPVETNEINLYVFFYRAYRSTTGTWWTVMLSTWAILLLGLIISAMGWWYVRNETAAGKASADTRVLENE